MENPTLRDTLTPSSLLTPEGRLQLWQCLKGMGQNRPPDPIEEVQKMRHE
jgi:hypothetical protein